MEILPIFRILKTESKAGQALQRQPEPEAIMTGNAQTLEYNLGADLNGPLLPIYLFHLPRMARLFKAGDEVLELGCGTAHILCMLAYLCPEVQFTGLDLSQQMLKHAKANQRKFEQLKGQPLKNLRFVEGSMTDLSHLTQKYNGVISNFAFHHLPSLNAVKTVFQQIENVTMPNASLYISDLIRPKAIQTIELLAKYSYQDQQSILNDDYKYSLHAAFSESEIQNALSTTSLKVRFSKTNIFGFIFFIKTDSSNKASSSVKNFVKSTLRLMPSKSRRDYWANLYT